MGEFKDLINSIIDEQVRGPGNKSGHGLAKKGQISQEPTETRPQTTPMGGGFGGFAHPQAGAGAGAGMRPGSEPSSKEGEFQKDIEKMDDPQPLAPESPLGMLIVKAFDQPVGVDTEPEEKPEEEGEDADETDSTMATGQHESLLLRNALRSVIEDYKGEEEVVTDKDGDSIDVPGDEWQKAQKTEPTMVQQMDEPFNVETKEGPAKGEKGDYLAKGVEGEMWPIDQEIFDKTHKIVDTPVVNKEGSEMMWFSNPGTNQMTNPNKDFPYDPAMDHPELKEAPVGKSKKKKAHREGAFGFGVGSHHDSVPSFHIAQAAQREQTNETVATNWQRNKIAKDAHLEKEAKRDKSLSHAGNIKGMGVPASTPDGHSELEQNELDVIDANWKDILKFSNHAFKSKPLPLAMRFIERFLEKKGVCAKHSMEIAGVIGKFFGQTTHPTSMIIPKAIPRITQEPNVKGSGHFFGGHPGPFHPV